MACCVVAALLFGSLRRLLLRLTPGRRPDLAFAPAARRPAPGPTTLTEAAGPSRAAGAAPPPVPTLRPLLVGLAAGVLVYAVGVDLLVAAGTLHAHGGLQRDVGLGVVVAALTLWSLACPPVGARRRRGATLVALAAAGITWTLAGAVEMHASAAVELHDHGLATDLAFHGAGLVLAALALGLLPRARRSAARPSAHPTARPTDAPSGAPQEVSA